MGYTHYWNQGRNLTKAEWLTVATDVRAILTYAQHECDIALAGPMGEGGTAPEVNDKHISINGVGDDCHETFFINRVIRKKPRYAGECTDWGFCKTARKPYDAVVTALLCYLSTVTRREDPATHEPIVGTEAWSVSSDGFGSDFLVGLDLARKALPQYGNVLDIPMDVMKSDRWCAPWVDARGQTQCEVRFCVDGYGYVLKDTGESYQFETHLALAQFLDGNKVASFKTGGSTGWGSYGREEPNIWNASGSFDKERHDRIARAQVKILSKLFPVDPACAHQPPAYVRPGQMPDNAGRAFCYNIGDLLNLANAA